MIGLIILLLFAVGFSYVRSRRIRARVVKKATPILGADVARSSENVRYFDYRGEVLRFKIEAKRALQTRPGKNLLVDIVASDFNPDGSVRNEIRSRNAEYDPERKIADFSGDVQLQFGKGVTVRANSLHYDLNANIGTTHDLLQVQSPEANGSARGMRFDETNRVLDLGGEVSFFVSRIGPGGAGATGKLHVTSERAHYSELAHQIILQGKARIVSDSTVLAGETIEGTLTSDQKRLTSIISTGNALYKSTTGNETRTLNGDRMVFTIGESAALEKIVISGQAAFASASPSQEQNLQASEISILFDSAQGSLKQIESWNGVQFRMKRGAEQSRIFGEYLKAQFAAGKNALSDIQVRKKARLTLEGSKEASGSDLQANDIDMDFSSEGDFLESASAAGNVVISQRAAGQGKLPQIRRLTTDSARFHFLPQNSLLLKDMDADGHVRITYEKKSDSGETSNFQTSSEKMSASFAPQNGGNALQSMTQLGNFRYQDATRTATAGRCDYDAVKELLVLKQSPRIADKTGETTGELIEFDQGQKILSVHRKVRSEISASKGENSLFGASSASSRIMVTADEMLSWTENEHIRYAGKVLLKSADQQLQAQTLEIFEGGDRVEAQGDVRHISEELVSAPKSKSKKPQNSAVNLTIIQSSKLNYLKKSNELTYLGNVSLRSGDMFLSSGSLLLVPDEKGKELKRAIAHNNVFIQRSGSECKGDNADWNLDLGKIVVDGKNVEVKDPKGALSSGRRLTWSTADDTISFE